MASIPEIPLGSTGKSIPVIGFGTAEFPFGESGETVKESILHAMKVGYRHFDSAAAYQSEKPLGEAIAEALRLGIVGSRNEFFITSKLWCSDGHADRVLPALQKTLENVGLEYLDLYLIHWPVSLKPGKHELPFKVEDIVGMDYKSVWEAMENCQMLGLTKAIGVSNFSCKKLQSLLATAKLPPAVNQVEMNPLWQQKKLRDYCKEKGIHVSAYSPLGGKGTPWGSNKVLECDVLEQIAKAKCKTTAQVCLRWVYEQGVSVLVKSFNKERIEQNIDIFDWKLSTDDSYKILQIPQQKGCPALLFISENGPFKSVDQFWDGEI